jgi:hypothetical protein
LKTIQDGGTVAILGLLKLVISPEWLDRFLTNFAGRGTEAIDRCSKGVVTFEINPIWRLCHHLAPIEIDTR